MPSPDISPYVDLTLYDLTPAEVAADAITYAQTLLPEFSPKTGTVEDAIIQASSQMTSQLIGAINRMTPGVMEVVLQLFDIERISGTQATGTISITVVDALGHTIPKGTRFGYLDNISDPTNPVLYAFDTTTDLTVGAGSSTGSVSIISTLFKAYPALLSGQVLQLLTSNSSILSASLSTNLVTGLDPETDTEYFARAVATLNSYSQALALASQMEQYVLANYSDVYRCQANSRVRSTADLWADVLQNGYVTVYASKPNGASLTSTAASAIAEDLMTHSVAGLSIAVKAPLLVTVPVVVTVKALSSYTFSDVQASISATLNTYLHPNYWGWGQTIYYNELISVIDQVAGVGRVVSLTINGSATDYSFTRRGSLPTHSSTISVT